MIKANVKKGTALLLAASMLSGLSLSAVDSISVHAGTTSEPSVTTYADRDTLIGDTFDPGESGTAASAVGKLKFGRVGDKAIEWYILGADDNIEGDEHNIAIFAADIIGGKKTVFDDTGFNDDYEESYIRKELRKMSGEEGDDTYNYFTPSEKAMMQGTEVITRENTEDVKTFHTTSDKLYLASVQTDRDLPHDTNYIYVGHFRNPTEEESVNALYEFTGKALPYDPYWGFDKDEYTIVNYRTDKDFWFRTASGYWGMVQCVNFDTYNYVYTSGFISYYYVNEAVGGIRPASNLSLSNVLFASVAEATSVRESGEVSTIDRGTDTAPKVAMTLRMKGDEDEAEKQLKGTIGGVKLEGDEVVVTKGTTNKTVTLIIQGKDAATDTDWYYAKTITADNAGEAVTASNITGYTNAELSQCKIWLEAEGTDGLIYAVNTEEKTAHEHNWSDKLTPYGSKQHGYECTDENCPDKGTPAGFKDLADHKYDKDNVCTECGYRLGDHIVYKVEKDPTSTEPGYKPHFECTECDKWFEYPAVNGVLVEITDKSAYIISATGKKISSGSSSSSSNISTGWIKDSKGWRFRNSDGTLAQGTTVTDSDGNKVEKVLWQKAGNGYFAFGSDGYLITGWIYDKLEDKWYYCDENLGKLYGWFYEAQDGYWYYLSPSTGEALTGWHSINGKDYYFAVAPSAPTYSFDASTDTWIYSNLNGVRPFGSMYANTITPDNYAVDANGAWIH